MTFKISHGSILAVFFQASSAEVMAGRRWYGDALAECQAIAANYGFSVDTVAGVVAALSPNNKWERNLIDADNLCKLYTLGGYDDASQCKVSTFHANKRKALQILEGTKPLEALGGLKVKAFYRCILDLPAVCVDGHAYAIWKGERIFTSKTPTISAKLYAAIAEDYQRAADTINGIIGTELCAAQVQAITWCAWRRIIKESAGETK